MTTEGPKILVIEDEQEIRRFLRVSLGSHGYRLVEADTRPRRRACRPPASSRI